MCNMTFSSYSSQSTRPVGRVLWEELLVLSRFHSLLQADELNFCSLQHISILPSVKGQHIVATYSPSFRLSLHPQVSPFHNSWPLEFSAIADWISTKLYLEPSD